LIYSTHISRKNPLSEACEKLMLKVPKSASLDRLRAELSKHWYNYTRHPPPAPKQFTKQRATDAHDVLASVLAPQAEPLHFPPPVGALPAVSSNEHDGVEEESEAALLRAYDVAGANAYEMLGYDDDDESDDEHEGDGGGDDNDDEEGPQDMETFRLGVRIAAVKRFEANRRAGGRKTQAAMVKAWNEHIFSEFVGIARKTGKIPDGIVDEHSLLLFIVFCAERPKRTRKGFDIPGTFIGASQLKKLFFGALRIRKEQDAADLSLAKKRPATSVIVYDSIKTRMDEVLERERNGLTPEEDAPDIRANTWLSQVTDEQLKNIEFGFLAHRQLRLAVWGHLAWTAQHASGNRGDDFRALKLAELQPKQLKHPDKRTDMYAVLGMQGEEKAGKRGMRMVRSNYILLHCTELPVINPVYSVFIANLKPEMCPLGAFAFYLHYIYDEKKIIETMELDYKINKSRRQIRVLHGPKSPTTLFNEQNLYNLYCRAYAQAGFKSRLKAHLPRHLLGIGKKPVDPLETSKLGWVRGQTYMDTYAPALPKTAILGAAGYQADEAYDPIWRKVRVPEQFLLLVCPMAEDMLKEVAGVEHLSGAFHHWQMTIELREYLFQCGAAIWQLVPSSSIFRLPAFQDTDVRNWMTTGYPAELSALEAATGSPIEIERIQNAALARALHGLRQLLSAAVEEIRELRTTVNRRTAVFTPARGFSSDVYHRNGMGLHFYSIRSNPNAGTLILPRNEVPLAQTSTPMSTPPHHSANNSPRRSSAVHTPRLVTQVELVLPPLAAFYDRGAPIGVVHPVLGMQSARWVEDVFPAIRQPEMCWEAWGPRRTLDQFDDVQAIWDIYTNGERISVNQDGTETHMKPPLKLVEQFFQHRWCTSTLQQKAWERFREIPEWIDRESTARRVNPELLVAELEDMRTGDGSEMRGINWLSQELARRRKQVQLFSSYSVKV
ncbi:hypothetical protein B0H19DRAFT_964399, partial [Mycena capillaripes]